MEAQRQFAPGRRVVLALDLMGATSLGERIGWPFRVEEITEQGLLLEVGRATVLRL